MPAPTPDPAADASDVTNRTVKVLVADDHPINLQVIALILGQAGVECSTVENGALAVEAFQSGPYDLVLMDVQMPIMDGLTAVTRIRSIEAELGLDRTPIAMLSANALLEQVNGAIAVGADDYLTKPVRPAELLALISRLPIRGRLDAHGPRRPRPAPLPPDRTRRRGFRTNRYRR